MIPFDKMKSFSIVLTGALVAMLCSCGGTPAGGGASTGGAAPAAGGAAQPALPPNPTLLQKPADLNAPAGPAVSQAAIDIVNEVGPDKSQAGKYVFHAKTDSALWVRGWAYDETHQTTPAAVWITLTSSGSTQTIYIPASRMARPDVAAGFKLPWAQKAGFSTPVITDHHIPRGTYEMNLYQVEKGTPELTKLYPYALVTLLVE